MRRYIIAGILIFILASLFFVFDPFNYWPVDHLIGKSCTPENLSPRCTGKIIFF